MQTTPVLFGWSFPVLCTGDMSVPFLNGFRVVTDIICKTTQVVLIGGVSK